MEFKAMKFRFILSSLALAFALILAVGSVDSSDSSDSPTTPITTSTSGGSGSTPSPTDSEPAEPEVADLEVLEFDSESDNFARYVVGKVRNNTKREYGYVQVEVNPLDKDGNIVGSTLDNVNNLGPGQTWKFNAIILPDDAVQFQIKDFTGF
jgi:GMP synthase-like glutamine amidotransferase